MFIIVKKGLLFWFLTVFFSFQANCECNDNKLCRKRMEKRYNELLVQGISNSDMPGVVWDAVAELDQVHFNQGEVTDFIGRLLIRGPISDLDYYGEVTSTTGFSYHQSNGSVGEHPFEGFEEFDSVFWSDKTYSELDPLTFLGLCLWEYLDENPSLIPENLAMTYVKFPEFDPEYPDIFSHPFLKELLKHPTLIDSLLRSQLFRGHDENSAFFEKPLITNLTRWDIDDQGDLLAFEWVGELTWSFSPDPFLDEFFPASTRERKVISYDHGSMFRYEATTANGVSSMVIRELVALMDNDYEQLFQPTWMMLAVGGFWNMIFPILD
ncbi:hypothetical protein SCG7086_CS_00020 [Chlamydiales bacterium SCGC AG-110-P3]|nr:hypothetical protein SCG7086_CS_00020 [Chlamydiales bacterium SCGC AG-110-P3]